MTREIRYRPEFTDEMIGAAVQVLKRGSLIRPAANAESEGALFEQEFSEWCGLEESVNVSSGTAAMHIALAACGIGPGDEVITVCNTFNSVADCIVLVGADPVFVDICPRTYNLDVPQLEAAVTERTKAIMPVHTAGHPVDMDPLMEIAQRRGLIVIEDACQALGARYKRRLVGTIGHVGCFSFVQNKTVSCGGEGGMLSTNDKALGYTARTMANHGRGRSWSTEGYHDMVGFNYRQSEILSAIGRLAIKRIESSNQRRRENSHLYKDLFARSGAPVVLPHEADCTEHSFLRFLVRVPRRDELAAFLKANHIDAKVHYPVPLHLDRAYQKKYSIPEGSFPVSEEFCRTVLTLPNYPAMTEADVQLVVGKTVEFFS